MIYGAVFVLSFVLSGICFLMSPGIGVATAGFVSILCVAAGLTVRKFFLILIASAIFVGNYFGIILAGIGVFRVWNALIAGLLLFLLLEIGYDATTSVRSKISWKTYQRRGRYLTSVSLITVAVVFLFVTLAYNISKYAPKFRGDGLVILALYLLMAGLSAIIVTAVQTRRRRADNPEKTDVS